MNSKLETFEIILFLIAMIGVSFNYFYLTYFCCTCLFFIEFLSFVSGCKPQKVRAKIVNKELKRILDPDDYKVKKKCEVEYEFNGNVLRNIAYIDSTERVNEIYIYVNPKNPMEILENVNLIFQSIFVILLPLICIIIKKAIFQES